MMTERTREITIGGVPKGVLLKRLQEKSISLNKYAEILFGDDGFTTSTRSYKVKMVEVSLEDLSLMEGGTSSQIFSSAKALGLELCPLELAPHLRLHYLSQAEGPYLTVASPKIKDDETFPSGFYLRRLGDGLWLRGYTSSSDYVWTLDGWPQHRFVFLVN